jgi:hypothetical protein
MSWDDDDDVGYRRPPSWTRFQKGRSGNPKGRPRRAPVAEAPPASESDDILRVALAKRLPVIEGGKQREASVQEMLQQATIKLASKGHFRALRHLLLEARELEERDRQRKIEAAREEENLFNYIVGKRASQARLWEDAAAQAKEPQEPWPHPDDILINHLAKTWHIRGPGSPDSVPIYEAFRADRDVNLMRAIIAIHRRPSRKKLASVYLHLYIAFDSLLPLRWQKGVDGWQADALPFLGQPLPLLEAILDNLERTARSFVRPALSPEDSRDVYQTTNRLMSPLLKPMGYRSLKQFETAYAEMGDRVPWPRKKAS